VRGILPGMRERKIPRDRENDYSTQAVKARQEFVREHTGSAIEHVSSYTLDPETLPGNVEHFFGVAQVPIGVAGPLLVNGEHAQGEFFVPLATTEGTLVASYNRGMKLMREAGGRRSSASPARGRREPSGSGSTSTSTRSRQPHRRPRRRASSSRSRSSPSPSCSTRGSTTRPETPPGRT
jgi:hydroxymethylglutaryl-CoA reductase (NADPH)